jgi:hypothetical protein|tara:strand:- start:1393 stop:2289 length:897 start_codon:yes stop_codon:yes gene_type:complete
MFGQITELPHLRTWQEAFDHYSSITPLRGTDIRPICATRNGRRKKQYQIEMRDNNDIACVLYATDVLLFHPDGEITFNAGGYVSTTTHSFATGILSGNTWNYRALFYTRKGRTIIELSTGEVLTVERDQIIKLRWNGDRITGKMEDRKCGAYEFIDKPPMYSYFVNRKKLNEHRQKVSKFCQTCTAYAKLVDPDDYTHADITRMYPSRKPADKVYASMTGSRKKQGELMEWLFYKATQSTWDYKTYTSAFHTDPKRLTKLIDDVIKYVFFEEVFNKQEVDKPNTNNNTQYAAGKETFI